jgi:inosose dehydratase
MLPAGCQSAATTGGAAKSGSPTRFQLGLASYTTREFTVDQTIEMAQRLALKYLCLNPKHLPLDSSDQQIQQIRQKVQSAGLTLYAAGVVDMTNSQETDRAFEYAKTAGLEVIVIFTKSGMLPAIEKKVKQYNIAIAIHNHGPEGGEFPTPLEGYNLIKNMDPRMGLCMDVGHTVRAGADPVAMVHKCKDRLIDVHLKDEDRADADGKPLEVGRGVIDIPGFLAALNRVGYKRTMSLEYEKDGKDPLPGMAESIGYARGALKTLEKIG